MPLLMVSIVRRCGLQSAKAVTSVTEGLRASWLPDQLTPCKPVEPWSTDGTWDSLAHT